MTASTDSAARSGLVDAWLHRCGTKPWRTYLVVWFWLFVLALVMGLIGFTRMELSLLPPPPEGIPYSKFVVGGSGAREAAIDLDPAKLPVFDPKLERRDVGLHVMPAKDSKPARLIAITRGTLITFGWPNVWVTWGSQQTWDVSDPTRPFTRCGDYFAPGGVYWHPHSLGFSRLSEGGSLGETVSIESAGAYSILTLPAGLAAVVVITSHVLDRSRRRWRERRHRCPECGHMRDPSRPDVACTECGANLHQNEFVDNTKRLVRPGLVCGIIFVSLLTIWIVLQFRDPSIERYASIAEKVAARQSMSRAFVRPVYDESRGYGWPMHFLYKQVNHWYAFGGPSAVKTPCPDPFVRHDGGYLVFSVKSADPSIASLWTIYCPPALLQIGLLQIVATILTSSIVLVSMMVHRKRSITPAPSTAAAHQTPASESSHRA